MARSPLPLELRLGSFRPAEAHALGVTDKRLRGSDLVSPHRGLHTTTAGTSLFERCTEYLPLLLPGQAYSHLTAAALWRLPLPSRADARAPTGSDLHVAFAEGRGPKRPGVIGHRCSDLSALLLQGLPVVNPLLAWAQCADLLELDDVVAMGDALAGRWSSQPEARELPLARLDAAVTAWGSRRGVRRLREARGLVRPNVWSPKETELRLLIVRAGLPEPPELNAPITGAAGGVLGHADLVYRDECVAVEYEGDGHRSSRAKWRRDVGRYESFQDAGWRVVRVTDDDLVSPGILLARLSRLLPGKALA